jgi:hypothetical protein
MTYEIIQNHDMSRDIETDWIQLIINNIKGVRKKAEALSLHICWDLVSSNPNGNIKVLLSNDQTSFTIAKTINVSTQSSIEDSHLIVIYPVFKYLKLIYTKNSISNGTLYSSLIYK